MVVNKEEFSIGEVSKATGVSVHTLRQWERRYGQPRAIKTSTGHRRYGLDEIIRVRLVQKAISLGFKTRDVVGQNYAELLSELENRDPNIDLVIIENWLNAVKSWDQAYMQNIMKNEWQKLGPQEFLSKRIIPFLNRIGESWRLHEISISQEHFFTELVRAFLSEKWTHLNSRNTGSVFILASLEGEEHNLGLHMCALILALNSQKVLFLGSNTPTDAIIQASNSSNAQAICISVSENFSVTKAREELQKIQKEVGTKKLMVGGAGAPHDVENIILFNNFGHFSDWLNDNQKEA